MSPSWQGDDHEDARENELALYRKLAGILGSLLLLTLQGFIIFYVSTVNEKLNNLQAQQNQRGERITAIDNRLTANENRLALNDSMTVDLAKGVREHDQFIQRLRVRFKIED